MASRADLIMTEFWDGLWSQQRRALAVFSYCDDLAQRLVESKNGYVPWSDLSTDERMKVIRSLPHLGAIAARAAIFLAQARAAMKAEAGPTLRESLTQQIAETVGLPVETIERHWRAKRARPR